MIRPAQDSAGSLPANRLWILDPWRDLLLFVLPPIWILPLMALIKVRVDVQTLGLWVLALGGLGHHLPGWIRAYSDPGLRREHPLRLTLGPAVILGTCVAFAFMDLGAMTFIYGAWSTWHGATQTHGFHRIYDAKAGAVSPLAARLDFALCLAWFGAAVLHSPGKLVALLGHYYHAGGPLLPVEALASLRWAWDAGTALVTLGFAVHTWRQYRVRAPRNPVKLLAMASSIGFWWGCLTLVDEMLYGVLLWEIFHDVQYNALIWVQGRKRVEEGLAEGRLERLLFRPGAGRILLYAGLTFLYGAAGLFLHYDLAHVADPHTARESFSTLLSRVAVVSALIHFYFDGFIWRVRKERLRQGLGIAPGGSQGSRGAARSPGWIGHGWKWGLFLAPVLWLGWRGYTGRVAPQQEIFRSLAAVAPGNWSIQFLLGFTELAGGRADSAIARFGRSLELKADQPELHELLGELHLAAGRLDEGVAHFEAAAGLGPVDAGLAERAAIAHMRRRDPASALPWLLRMVEGDSSRPWAWNHLGLVREALGDAGEAEAMYLRALSLDSGYSEAAGNLARVRGMREPASRP
jgi:hypothetical protein